MGFVRSRLMIIIYAQNVDAAAIFMLQLLRKQNFSSVLANFNDTEALRFFFH